MATTIKISVETRDRIKAMGGETYEDTIIEALDALDRKRFWDQADAARRWRESLPPEERARIEEAERKAGEELDRWSDAMD
jgi:hypothetical protein